MKKYFRLIIIAVVVLAIAAGATVTGVLLNKKRKVTEVVEGEEGTLTSGDLNIRVWSGGFGYEWLENLADGFMAKNKGTNVEISASVERTQVFAEIRGASKEYDIYISESSLQQYTDGLEPVDDVFEWQWKGEDKKVGEKIDDTYFESVRVGDHRYMVPAYTGTYGFVYNRDIVSFEEGKEPVTTDEFLAYLDSLPSSATKIIFGGLSGINYWSFAYYPWYAQYEGRAAYTNMLYGKNAAGEYDPAVATLPGQLEALKVCESLLGIQKGYIDKQSMGYDNIISQRNFLKGGYAFMYNGSWMMNEMINHLDDNMRFGMLKIPVISALGVKLGITDEQLAGAVRAVDAGETSYAGLTDEQFEAVRDARTFTYCAGEDATAVIPSRIDEGQKLIAKRFLEYMYSEEGIRLHASALSGGVLPVKGYSSDIIKTELSNAPSNLADFLEDAYRIMFSSSKFFNLKNGTVAGIALHAPSESIEKYFASQNPSDRKSAEQLYEDKQKLWTEDYFWRQAQAAGISRPAE